MLVAHADWGVHPRKRWVAVARGDVRRGWDAGPAAPMPEGSDLRIALGASHGESLLVGFDFPIGLPRAYAQRAGIRRFLEVLPVLGQAEWVDFFDVADDASEISIHRPFYPRTASQKGAKRRVHLTDALGLSFDELRRRCERRQPTRAAACSLFWTVGGNQVGKGALAGWRMLQAQPPRRIGCWPFDGPLSLLLESRDTVVAEAYPAEFYGHLGLPRVVGKRKQAARAAQGATLLHTATELDVRLEPALHHQIVSGFGPDSSGEDAFDAVVGLLGMLNVVSGRRPTGEPLDDEAVERVEGWILGQHPI